MQTSFKPPLLTMSYHELLIKIEEHVNVFYREHADEKLFYHNQSHTKDVLETAKRMADHYQLDDQSFFIVCAAACFHDTGYLLTKDENHELKSAELADTFLTGIGVNEEDITEIKKCILATKMPQYPDTLAEKIICDADLFNLGTAAFREKNKLLKKEKEALSDSKVDGIAWRAATISMLENHVYHTDYCQLLLNKTKNENLDWIQNKQVEIINKAQSGEAMENKGDDPKEIITGAVDNKTVIKLKKKDRPVKGIETMFRITASNNVRISVMADNKAHIMISVNSIIISVVLGLIIKNLDEHRNLLVPTILLLTVNVTTIIYSVLATRPKISDGFFTREQVVNKSVNLLYFGSYYNMNYKEYDEGIKAMMSDSEFLYGSLTKDIFWQGKVLGRKYRLLRISYTVFMYGIVAAVIAYAATAILIR